MKIEIRKAEDGLGHELLVNNTVVVAPNGQNFRSFAHAAEAGDAVKAGRVAVVGRTWPLRSILLAEGDAFDVGELTPAVVSRGWRAILGKPIA